MPQGKKNMNKISFSYRTVVRGDRHEKRCWISWRVARIQCGTKESKCCWGYSVVLSWEYSPWGDLMFFSITVLQSPWGQRAVTSLRFCLLRIGYWKSIFFVEEIEKLFSCTVAQHNASNLHPCGIFPKWCHKNGACYKDTMVLYKCVIPQEMIHWHVLCAFLRMHCGHAWCEGNESCENVVYVLHSENEKCLVTRLASA